MNFRKISFSRLLIFALSIFAAACPAQPDSTEKIVVRNISMLGNKTTKRFIITRELTFSEGDTLERKILGEKIIQSEKNLMNTSLFNFATIEVRPDTLLSGPKRGAAIQVLDIVISLTERWYVWPVPIFELAETNFNTWWKGKNFGRTNYGIYVVKENFRGRKELIRFKLQLGFTEQFAMQYQIPYINRKQTLGVSVTGGYWGNHEVNYGTYKNKRLFLKDREKYLREELYSRLTFTYRKELYTTHLFEVQYIDGRLADTVPQVAPDFFRDGNSRMQYFYLLWQFRHDKRDYKSYPLDGYCFGIDLIKYGLGVFPSEPNSLTSYFTVTKFHRLLPRLFFANGAYMKLTFLRAPSYSFQRGLGYDDYVRGYEYYVIDGQNYGLLRSNLKFLIHSSKEEKVPIIKNEKFGKFFFSLYLNAYLDVGYVRDQLYFRDNPLSNSLMRGTGLGLDLMTYYDMVTRAEYSINKMGEPGFYLSFKKAI